MSSKPKPLEAVQQAWAKDLPSSTYVYSKQPNFQPVNSHNHISPIRYLQRGKNSLVKDSSIQSDDASSICSSIESMLELRRPDPEEVLLGLGFGPPFNGNSPGRIPQRFLQPSKLLKNIDLEKFLEEQGELPLAQQGFHSLSSSPLRLRPRVYSST